MSAQITAPRTPEEFTDWVRPCIPTIMRLASRLAPSSDRDDVVQETLARAWMKRDQFDPKRGTPMAWLLAITSDQARRARRRRRPWPLSQPSARVRPAEDRLDLEYAISMLPERQRLAIECFYFVGLSVLETAVVMSCAEGTVKSSLADARANLRRTLEGPDDGLR